MKKIAVLTSGGDSPGMNNAVSAVIKMALVNGIEPYIIKDGFKGLVNGDIELTNLNFAQKINNYGGTAIGTARMEEFRDQLEIRQNAANNLKKHKIDGLVIIGGDGSYNGALALSNLGIKCVALPGTIDNDIVCTDFTIGFDTTLNIVVDAIDRIRDTNNSHNRCGIIEVMGRHCGDIALFTGLGSGVEIISSSQSILSQDEIINRVKKFKENNYRSVLIVVSENLYDVSNLAKEIETQTKYVTRATTLGHIQRGGRPSANDRLLATKMGYEAVHQLLNNKSGICLAINDNKIKAYDLKTALNLKRKLNDDIINLIDEVK